MFSFKCQKFWNCWKQCLGPSCGSLGCSQCGLTPNDFPSLTVRKELFSPRLLPSNLLCIDLCSYLGLSLILCQLHRLKAIYGQVAKVIYPRVHRGAEGFVHGVVIPGCPYPLPVTDISPRTACLPVRTVLWPWPFQSQLPLLHYGT